MSSNAQTYQLLWHKSTQFFGRCNIKTPVFRILFFQIPLIARSPLLLSENRHLALNSSLFLKQPSGHVRCSHHKPLINKRLPKYAGDPKSPTLPTDGTGFFTHSASPRNSLRLRHVAASLE